jgi:hypothetical protein
MYPGEERPRFPHLHPGFTKDEAKRLIAECEAANIALIIGCSSPQPKYVDFVKPGKPDPVPPGKYFYYPYEGYEECCAKHGCEPVAESWGRTHPQSLTLY